MNIHARLSLSGRFSFDYLGFAEPGDEIGIFRGDECIGSSSSINPVGYYNDLKINSDSINYILNKISSVNVKAFNLKTKSLWKTEVIYNPDTENLDFYANKRIGYIPEPSTIALFGAGAVALGLIKRK
ncbi:MAG: PEP-CTERM sorting domain-containing protein [Nanoarchaeota archaeon]